jgi:hypothetical protein
MARLSPTLHLADNDIRAHRPDSKGGDAMNATLKRKLRSLLYAGAALMILVAGTAEWPRH